MNRAGHSSVYFMKNSSLHDSMLRINQFIRRVLNFLYCIEGKTLKGYAFCNNIKSCNLNSAFETLWSAFNSGTRKFSSIKLMMVQLKWCIIIVVVRRKMYNTVISLFFQLMQ
jgi:hypothetical protein